LRTDDPRRALRQQLRARRRDLGAAEREHAAGAADKRLADLGLPRPGSRVAAYLPMDGELDPALIIARALSRGCEVYAPVITRFRERRMRFARLDGRASVNRWGIAEPATDGSIDGRWLDLVLVPCVAFDAAGNRLGMGAGFYDRHFAFLRRRSTWTRPRLVGLAYEFQHVAGLAPRPWDVPLWRVITESGVHGDAGPPRPLETDT